MSKDELIEQQQMDSDSDDYIDDINYDNIKQEGEHNNGAVQQSMKHFQPTNKILSKYVDKIDVSPYSPRTGHIDDGKYRSKDKHDRATVEQVLDPRTRLILFKFLQQGLVDEINGCISTGKEANVYYAKTNNNEHRAIKVFKTSILVFKDRDRYVTGEYRFRHGYSRHNPRKMVRLWAEKEYRNLSRLYTNGIPCPKPIGLKNHVLVMEFIGENGWPATKLKDSPLLDESEAFSLYLKLIHYMRIMFVKCKLIHADLSEFNLLLDSKNQLYIIDVSQSVEQAHPNALEFLRMDCRNITDYFAKRYTLKTILTMQQLFNYITDPTINDTNEQAYLDKMIEQAKIQSLNETTDEVDERVFERIFIPQTLDDLCQTSSKDFRQVSTILGMNETMTEARLVPKILEDENDNSSSTSSSSSSDDDDDDDDDDTSDYASAKEELEQQTIQKGNIRPRDESPTSKRLRKQVVKEQKREKRKTKIPKHVKKRAEKIGGDKRKRKG
ncbi:unnamed protein product [Rotaria sordida]|uniref:Serine/threonine-protein kinase RIO1 n=2 Tax=Rotaria sordida TaxID=392033 RepID=A0A819EBA8_9BILA|nr:unnamed protein product [Rotaria sordida]CAF3847417.1 unnamed protein product [Rotaria sordida]